MASDDTERALARSQRLTKQIGETAKQIEMELVKFSTGDRSIPFNIDVTAETVWATQAQIADLFEKGRSTIAEHVQAILTEGELDAGAVCRKFRQTGTDGKAYEVMHYDLDMILAVGFRVKSPRATEFRKWAYKTLRAYIVDGYALNESRLRDDPDATNRLAAKLREIRADEANIYASVREFFKIASSDYDAKSRACSSFYARLQDTFHYAVTGATASQLILKRANHREPNMGLQSFAGNLPTIDEAKIGKNYLDSDELYTLHILCEQFLLYVQSKAMRGKSMTMGELSMKFNALLEVNDYPVFPGYKDFLKDKATKHAQVEYARFTTRLKHDDVKRISGD